MEYPTDQLSRYTFNDHDVRGELVQLTSSYQTLIRGHNYPAAVQEVLGHMMAAVSLLTATLKFEGHIAVQLQGDGPLNFVAVNGNHKQELRGIARLRAELEGTDLRSMIGKGQLIITLTPDTGERYQGVVSGDADSIAEMLENYFEQSEQLHTKVWLHADGEHAAGMLLQRLPSSGQDLTGFEHLATLTDTITAQELYTVPAEELLHRLYHEETVHLYPAQPVSFVCGCSRDKTLDALASVKPEELKEILDRDGEIVMTCDYCLTEYVFKPSDFN
ncbi:Hsp33 family molecular chaperone HslO [Idiomarina sp. X4]|jgi:molecular chaperone Hsp33|uniref:Hsp33 family molecular chaperone HslO n=1 Tax=unclassified Idiomarina TaxID=2614829 RepID=UPI000C289271|nr:MULTISPECIES: Hsp33 family molecular chaperone HslO [unclassified Idiomarina]ATZ73717.1 Hsp33 family molecular chaperone HslO [Idiomarina sp. X4]RXS42418.1 Hsp33 family molecular chaperone HslO [Idiomarina sp. 29L]